MKPLIRKLIGGVEESDTKEYLFEISAQTMDCRERSRLRVQEHQEHETRRRIHVFGEKEGEEEEVPGWGPMWALGALWARPGGRPRHLGQGWPPWSTTGVSG